MPFPYSPPSTVSIAKLERMARVLAEICSGSEYNRFNQSLVVHLVLTGELGVPL